LIVEDEAAICELIAGALDQDGFDCLAVHDARAAQDAISRQAPDLILMDWMLPGQSGFDLVQRLKRNAMTRAIPVIMLTARSEESDKVQGLEGGADDYMTKPFSLVELSARARAALRRTAASPPAGRVDVRGLLLEEGTRRVVANGKAISLGPTEFRLLQFFMTHPERVYSRSQLIDQVWGTQVYVEERTVDVHVRRLRKALEPSGHAGLIQTVRGSGYRFSNQD